MSGLIYSFPSLIKDKSQECFSYYVKIYYSFTILPFELYIVKLLLQYKKDQNIKIGLVYKICSFACLYCSCIFNLGFFHTNCRKVQTASNVVMYDIYSPFLALSHYNQNQSKDYIKLSWWGIIISFVCEWIELNTFHSHNVG